MVFLTSCTGGSTSFGSPATPPPTIRETAAGYALGSSAMVRGALDVSSVDGQHAWVTVFDCSQPTSLAVVSTADGGRTWSRHVGPSAPCVGSGFPPSVQTVFATAQDGWLFGSSVAPDLRTSVPLLFVTHDGGGTWTAESAPGRLDALAVAVAGHVLWGVAALCQPTGQGPCHDALIRSRDAGRTWEKIQTPTIISAPNVYVSQLVVRSDTDVWLVTNPFGSMISSTHDGGRTWSSGPLPCPQGDPRPESRPVAFSLTLNDATQMWGVCTIDEFQTAYIDPLDLRIYRSADNAAHWADVGKTLPTQRSLSNLGFGGDAAFAAMSADVAWIALSQVRGAAGPTDESVWMTRDAGRTWNEAFDSAAPATGGKAAARYLLKFADALHGWVVGASIWRTDDGGGSWTSTYRVLP